MRAAIRDHLALLVMIAVAVGVLGLAVFTLAGLSSASAVPPPTVAPSPWPP